MGVTYYESAIPSRGAGIQQNMPHHLRKGFCLISFTQAGLLKILKNADKFSVAKYTAGEGVDRREVVSYRYRQLKQQIIVDRGSVTMEEDFHVASKMLEDCSMILDVDYGVDFDKKKLAIFRNYPQTRF